MEGAATTVYATGGRGNARLVAWEGERTVTFTMEDALISPTSLSILTGAGLIDAKDKPIIMHTTEQTDKVTKGEGYVEITLSAKPYVKTTEVTLAEENTAQIDPTEDYVYIMVLDEHGEVKSEPYIASEIAADITEGIGSNNQKVWKVRVYGSETGKSDDTARVNDLSAFTPGCVVLVDYYVEHTSGAFQIDITPDMFGGNFYLEALTLFRDTNGVDMPAEFIIPNCKVQSNFTFTMASSGDPSTFTFTLDAFPDYTRWDKTKKVYAAIQVLEQGEITADFERLGTYHNYSTAETAYNEKQKPYLEENY